MLDNAPRARYTLIHCALDDVIPFCEWFVLPYCSWFLLLAAALLFLWRTDTTSYRRLCLAMFSGMTFCLLLYMAWPTALSLRPEVLPRDNFASALLRLLWAADTPTNVCPSIHCQSSAVIGLVMWHSAPASRRRALRWASVLWARAHLCFHRVRQAALGRGRGVGRGAGPALVPLVLPPAAPPSRLTGYLRRKPERAIPWARNA